jgi:hypothetical protein
MAIGFPPGARVGVIELSGPLMSGQRTTNYIRLAKHILTKQIYYSRKVSN